MINMYFGNYLLRNRLIDAATLRSILGTQEDTHLRLGVLAMHEGLMTAEQVDNINEMQKNVDCRFGELAVKQQYLKEEDLNWLLNLQAKSGAQLTQLLLDQAIFTPTELEEILKKYRTENNFTEKEEESLEQGDAALLLTPYMKKACKGAGADVVESLTAFGALFVRNMIRFVDRRVVLDLVDLSVPKENAVAVGQILYGDFNGRTVLVMEENAYWALAQNHAKMDLKGDHELAEASVTEFLNLHNGLFSVWLSENAIKTLLKPPERIEIDIEFQGDEWIKMPLLMHESRMTMLISIEDEKTE